MTITNQEIEQIGNLIAIEEIVGDKDKQLVCFNRILGRIVILKDEDSYEVHYDDDEDDDPAFKFKLFDDLLGLLDSHSDRRPVNEITIPLPVLS